MQKQMAARGDAETRERAVIRSGTGFPLRTPIFRTGSIDVILRPDLTSLADALISAGP
jgi:hypothetical protein